MGKIKKEYTPGPWTLELKKKKCYSQINGDGWWGLCKVVTKQKGNESHINEGIANAKLVAAAPELLESLIEVLPRLKYWLNQPDKNIDNDEMIKKAESAIKKATE